MRAPSRNRVQEVCSNNSRYTTLTSLGHQCCAATVTRGQMGYEEQPLSAGVGAGTTPTPRAHLNSTTWANTPCLEARNNLLENQPWGHLPPAKRPLYIKDTPLSLVTPTKYTFWAKLPGSNSYLFSIQRPLAPCLRVVCQIGPPWDPRTTPRTPIHALL